MDKIFKFGQKEIVFKNTEKIFWPEMEISKGELLEYYLSISKYLLPHLINRPFTMHRFPNGIYGEKFFQKNLEHQPEWLKTYPFYSSRKSEVTNFALCQDLASLIYLINLGNIEMNVWSSTYKNPLKPTFLVIDLDPHKIEFEAVIKTALEFKKLFQELKIDSYPKTSGASGIHIYIPLKGQYTFQNVKKIAHILALIVHQRIPEFTSLERLPKKRQKKVYLDYLQNNQGATMVSPYSVRPTKEATVSTPLEWKEVKIGLKPTSFNIKNILKRINLKGDIFLPTLTNRANLSTFINKKIESLEFLPMLSEDQ